jgi:hypothetical protein
MQLMRARRTSPAPATLFLSCTQASVAEFSRETLVPDEGQSSYSPRDVCPLAATSERPHPQGQVAPVELAGDSDFLAPFWRIGVIEMAC